MQVREMTIADYEQVYDLWTSVKGFAIRSIDDSKESIEKFLKRNPSTSMVAQVDGKIVGSVLCGHDGRRASLYHVCVEKSYRKQGIGSAMVHECEQALKEEGISKVCLVAFTSNEVGNQFWKDLDWEYRSDINYYEQVLNTGNHISYV